MPGGYLTDVAFLPGRCKLLSLAKQEARRNALRSIRKAGDHRRVTSALSLAGGAGKRCELLLLRVIETLE